MIGAAWALLSGAVAPLLKGAAELVRAVPWQVWVLVALLAGWWFERQHHGEERYAAGYGAAEARYTAEIDRREREAAAAMQAAKDAARATEQRQAQQMADAARDYIAEREKGFEERDRTIADLRAGERRLRDRFQCPASGAAGGSAGLPGAGRAAGGSDAPAPGGLSRADAEFLVRFAGEADDVAGQLAACQAVVRAQRFK